MSQHPDPEDFPASLSNDSPYNNHRETITTTVVSEEGNWRADVTIVEENTFGQTKSLRVRLSNVRPVPSGVLGQTYFAVGVGPRSRQPVKVYLNGDDVSARCREVDIVGGWVWLFDVDQNGHKKGIHTIKTGRVYFGRVSLAPDGQSSPKTDELLGRINDSLDKLNAILSPG